MEEKKRSFLEKVTRVRLIIGNILFFAILFFVLGTCSLSLVGGALLNLATAKPTKGSVLHVNPQGTFFEDSYWSDSSDVYGNSTSTSTFYFDVTESLRLAINDKKIETILLDLSGLWSVSLVQVEELTHLIQKNQEKGKKVLAFAYDYNQSNYLLASAADFVYLERRGTLQINGLALKSLFYGGFLDKFFIEVETFRTGTFKSGIEPWMGEKFTPESKQNLQQLVDSLWPLYLEGMGENREMEPPYSTLSDYIYKYSDLLKEQGYDPCSASQSSSGFSWVDGDLFSNVALNAGLIDFVVDFPYQGDLDTLLKSLELPDDSINYLDYLDARSYIASKSIAVITVDGAIMEQNLPKKGYASPTLFKEKLEQAFSDSSVCGVVIRVNSPGGSAIASEAMREALFGEMNNNNNKKPVVISMGDMAASGGYWICMVDAPIYASLGTLTGSIGVYGLVPNFGKALNHFLGMTIDGVSIGGDGGINGLEPLTTKQHFQIQASINQTYSQFLTLVSQFREKSVEEILPVAGGRVLTGEPALVAGLVDEIGGLYVAIDKVAELAKVRRYKIDFMKREKTLSEKFTEELINEMMPPFSVQIKSVTEEKGLEELLYLNDSKSILLWNPIRWE